MSQPDQFRTSNSLLKAFANDDLALLRPHLTRVGFDRGHVMVTPNVPVAHVYFPEDGVGSIVSDMAESGHTEAGIFGREGMSATCLLLGSDRSPHQSFVQVEGAGALRIDTAPFVAAVAQSESLRVVMLRYVQTVLVQSAQNTATNAHHRMEVRLARWLVMCHDRVEHDQSALTHEFMGMMISADRSGVTVTLHELEGRGLIRSRRGLVIVQDR